MSEKQYRMAELVKLGNCAVCGEKQLAGMLPMFYRVTIARAVFDGTAIQRAAGLEMAHGPIAHVLGPDEPLAKVFDGPHEVFVHEHCATDIGHLLSLIPESKS